MVTFLAIADLAPAVNHFGMMSSWGIQQPVLRFYARDSGAGQRDLSAPKG
jgi:hypothetical protein